MAKSNTSKARSRKITQKQKRGPLAAAISGIAKVKAIDSADESAKQSNEELAGPAISDPDAVTAIVAAASAPAAAAAAAAAPATAQVNILSKKSYDSIAKKANRYRAHRVNGHKECLYMPQTLQNVDVQDLKQKQTAQDAATSVDLINEYKQYLQQEMTRKTTVFDKSVIPEVDDDDDDDDDDNHDDDDEDEDEDNNDKDEDDDEDDDDDDDEDEEDNGDASGLVDAETDNGPENVGSLYMDRLTSTGGGSRRNNRQPEAQSVTPTGKRQKLAAGLVRTADLASDSRLYEYVSKAANALEEDRRAKLVMGHQYDIGCLNTRARVRKISEKLRGIDKFMRDKKHLDASDVRLTIGVVERALPEIVVLHSSLIGEPLPFPEKLRTSVELSAAWAMDSDPTRLQACQGYPVFVSQATAPGFSRNFQNSAGGHTAVLLRQSQKFVYDYVTRQFPQSEHALLEFLSAIPETQQPTEASYALLEQRTGYRHIAQVTQTAMSLSKSGGQAAATQHVSYQKIKSPTEMQGLGEFEMRYNSALPTAAAAAATPELASHSGGISSGNKGIDASSTARQAYVNGSFSIDYRAQARSAAAATSAIETQSSSSSSSDQVPSHYLKAAAAAAAQLPPITTNRIDVGAVLRDAGLRDTLDAHVQNQPFWKSIVDFCSAGSYTLPDPIRLTPQDVRPFLFAPYGKRRPCSAGSLCRGRTDFGEYGVTLMEFWSPDQERIFRETGMLPQQRTTCVLCARYIIQRMINEIRRNGHGCVKAVSPHYYTVDEPGGYARAAMVPNQPDSTDGNCWPQRHYDPSEYVPVVQDVVVPVSLGSDDGERVTVRGFEEIECFFV